MSWANPKITEEQMRALRIELATRLGEGWEHNPDAERNWEGSQIKRRSDGARILVNASSSQNGKVHIHCHSDAYADMTMYARQATPMPNINVSFERGTDVIFREIQRRVLPELDAAQAAALAARDEKRAYGRKHQETIDRITAAFGKHVWRISDTSNVLKGEAPQVAVYADREDPRVDVKIQGPGSIDFEIDCRNPGTAVKIAEFLTTLLDKTEAK